MGAQVGSPDRQDSRVFAVVLTGGRSRRFGGRHKPAVAVAGTPVLSRIVSAVHDVAVGQGLMGESEGVSIWIAGPLDGLSESERAQVQQVLAAIAHQAQRYGIPVAHR